MQFLHDYTVDFTCIKTLIAGNLTTSLAQCWLIQLIALLWMLMDTVHVYVAHR